MITRKLASSLLLVGLLSPLLIGLTTANASQGHCGQATLSGKYGALEQGTVLMDIGVGVTPPFPVALSAIASFDGAGDVSGTFWASFGGVPVSGSFTGTYTVHPDCTYSDTITPEGMSPAHRVGTITGEGKDQELQMIYTDAWLAAYGTVRKTPVGGCSARTLNGTYEVFGQGMDMSYAIPIPGFPAPPFPAAHVGTLTADGAGHFSGSDVEKVDVAAMPTAFTAEYSITPDCAYTVTITNDSGLVVHEAGTITGWDESQQVRKIMTDPGWVFADTARKMKSR
jgi:hypothetical protein